MTPSLLASESYHSSRSCYAANAHGVSVDGDGFGPPSCMNRIIPKGIPVLPPHGVCIFRWLRPSRVCIALPLWGPCAAVTPTPHPRSNNSSFTFGHRNLSQRTAGKLMGHHYQGCCFELHGITNDSAPLVALSDAHASSTFYQLGATFRCYLSRLLPC